MTRVPQCQCLAATETALMEQGLMLSTVWVQVSGKAIECAALETIKLNPKDRNVRTRMILATYCPFCGLAYVEPDAAPTGGTVAGWEWDATELAMMEDRA